MRHDKALPSLQIQKRRQGVSNSRIKLNLNI